MERAKVVKRLGEAIGESSSTKAVEMVKSCKDVRSEAEILRYKKKLFKDKIRRSMKKCLEADLAKTKIIKSKESSKFNFKLIDLY
mmetsp:Transcript_27024/g.31184  ORF Transcript_27024/g.31184 Transcript_27024/m.31184 type:complete len:85 (+) Transcript_27024:45-299(+)